MANLILAETGAAAYCRVLHEVCASDSVTSPRGLPTRELTDITVVVGNATTAVPRVRGRNMNPCIGAVEYCQLLAGVSCLPQLDEVSRNKFSAFSDDGQLKGAYGPRVYSQLPVVAGRLTQDASSRQGVVTIWHDASSELKAATRDVPCTVALIFKIRRDALHLTVHMRSSDVWLGIPYDWWQFSRLQMSMAWALGVPAGEFIFTASSLHIYEPDVAKAAGVMPSDETGDVIPEVYPENLTGEQATLTGAGRMCLAQAAAENIVFGRLDELDHGALFYGGLVPPVSYENLCLLCRYVRDDVKDGLCVDCEARRLFERR